MAFDMCCISSDIKRTSYASDITGLTVAVSQKMLYIATIKNFMQIETLQTSYKLFQSKFDIFQCSHLSTFSDFEKG